MPKRMRNVYLHKLALWYVREKDKVVLDLMLQKYPLTKGSFGPQWHIFFKCVSHLTTADAEFAKLMKKIYKYTGVTIPQRHPSK